MNVKNLFVSAMLGLMVGSAVAQSGDVKPQSIAVEFNQSNIAVTYLNDGYDGFSGVTYRVLRANDKLSLNLLTVTDLNNGSDLYAGTTLNYQVWKSSGYSLDFSVGYKGFNFSDGTFAENRGLVFGVRVAFPLASAD